MRVVLPILMLLFVPASAAYVPPSTLIHSDALEDAQWLDASGTTHDGVNGSGQYIVYHEEYDAFFHPAMRECYGTINVELVREWEIPFYPNGHGTAGVSLICGHDPEHPQYNGIALGSRMLSAFTLYPASPGSENETNEFHIQEKYHPKIYSASVGSAFDPYDVPANTWGPYAQGADMVVTLAIGNEGGDGSEATGSINPGDDRVVLVGAANSDATGVASYSSRGAKNDPWSWPVLMAPGCVFIAVDPIGPDTAAISIANQIIALVAPDVCPVTDEEYLEATLAGYTLSAGTSFATPIVAAVFALMLHVNPELTHQQLIYLATRTADPFLPTNDTNGDGVISPEEFHDEHGWEAGWGLINATAAVAAANYMGLHPEADEKEAAVCWTVGRTQDGRLRLNPENGCPTRPREDPGETEGDPGETDDPAVIPGNDTVPDTQRSASPDGHASPGFTWVAMVVLVFIVVVQRGKRRKD